MHQQGGERSWLMTEEMHRGPLLRVPFSPIQTISRTYAYSLMKLIFGEVCGTNFEGYNNHQKSSPFNCCLGCIFIMSPP